MDILWLEYNWTAPVINVWNLSEFWLNFFFFVHQSQDIMICSWSWLMDKLWKCKKGNIWTHLIVHNIKLSTKFGILHFWCSVPCSTPHNKFKSGRIILMRTGEWFDIWFCFLFFSLLLFANKRKHSYIHINSMYDTVRCGIWERE